MFNEELQSYDVIAYESEEDGILKEILLNKLKFSVRAISKMKRYKTINVNGDFRKLNTEIKKGDLITVKIDEEKSEFKSQDLGLNIIYDDFDIIVVDKPANMVVHPTKSHSDTTMANGVTHYIEEKGYKVKIRFVNRLDMNTSGLVIVAKNAYAHYTLSESMKSDFFKKKYIAIVKGIVKDDEGIINEPIYRTSDDSIKRVVDERGQESITKYKVIERLNDATMLELELLTGRTHQIRVHLSHIGHGIIGDELYGYYDENLFKRQALHAYSLEFEQPRTKKELKFKSEIPEDIKELIEK
ncbi:MAG: RluA family pseudouridine synthase, partial [Clostridioides sp.]|nr:RluA family pseudouridine synthase [Clostridioides sp.]